MRESEIGAALLAWYDRHARVLPWRVGPADHARGVQPDPYRVWLSEIMLQQTTVAAVTGYFHRFTARWPTVGALAAAADADVMAEWAGLGYYARARNLLKCARVVVQDHGGVFPDTREGLQALPGIGPYTAGAVASIAFERPEVVVDGNVERVMARLYALETPLPTAKRELVRLATRLTPSGRPGDHAQAAMDLGATICTPKSPACGICPLSAACRARALGIAAALPRRLPRQAKPVRRGVAYIGRRADGAWLLERRPDKGLLGGMLGWPGAPWGDLAEEAPPMPADWQNPGIEVRHTLTHFHLILSLRVAHLPTDATPATGHFIAPAKFRASDLPTVMRKCFDAASATLCRD